MNPVGRTELRAVMLQNGSGMKYICLLNVNEGNKIKRGA